jgi:hypothetical protein
MEMDMDTPTGSVSDRNGWEWSRTHGETSSRESDHPRTFAPARYDSQREQEPGTQDTEHELEELRKELRRRKQHREQIIRRYELRLAEKNRKLADKQTSRESDDLLATLLDSLQR